MNYKNNRVKRKTTVLSNKTFIKIFNFTKE